MATANSGNNDNESQFFFTLGATQELQNKHTIFGKVTGDTLYNLVKFNDLDIDRVYTHLIFTSLLLSIFTNCFLLICLIQGGQAQSSSKNFED